MSTRRMRPEPHVGVRAAAVATLSLVLCLGLRIDGAVAQVSERATATTVEPHTTLEDPFNRAFLLDRLEARDGGADLAWDARFWAGYTFDKVLLRTEGKKDGGTTEQADLELLWAHAVTPWWEIVAGAASAFAPGEPRTSAAFGVQGVAPYRFDVEATLYFAEGGATFARVEAEYGLLITPRLILEPRVEAEWHGRGDAARGIGAGLARAETGLRLRYELRREIAPYVGIVRERAFGRTADLLRASGGDPEETRLVAGLRLCF